MAFNTKYPYMRLKDWTSRTNEGTHTIQTSGDVSSTQLTGKTIFSNDYTTHSYQMAPITGVETSGIFHVEGSNDDKHWTKIPGTSLTFSGTGVDGTTASQFLSIEFYSAYCRPILTGQSVHCLINEIHQA